MKYCSKCLYPDTKPDLFFKDGVCSACTAFEERQKVNWGKRLLDFQLLACEIKNLKRPYDAIVPVSGGKDSHYQVFRAKEAGLHVLAVNATTDDLSTLGRQNLDNISRLGVDVIEVNTNNDLRRKINAYTLRTVGDISWAEHVTIFTVPIRVAIQYNVPLIIWGENPQNEYGGPYQAQTVTNLNNRWLQEYGGLNSLRVNDLVAKGIATQKDMQLYHYPDVGDNNISGIFLGHYFPWDGYENAVFSRDNLGFKWNTKPVEGIGYEYENLDNYQTGIHDRFKYLKFGFGRATDLVCNHIRRKRITRAEGIEHILTWDGRYAGTYLGKSFEAILEPLGVTIDEYNKIELQFINRKIFIHVGNGSISRNFTVGKNA